VRGKTGRPGNGVVYSASQFIKRSISTQTRSTTNLGSDGHRPCLRRQVQQGDTTLNELQMQLTMPVVVSRKFERWCGFSLVLEMPVVKSWKLSMASGRLCDQVRISNYGLAFLIFRQGSVTSYHSRSDTKSTPRKLVIRR
jgi:hypothetical protein